MMNSISMTKTDHDRLCLGRTPLATAMLKGTVEGAPIEGRVDCYGTPAGVRISVTVGGLPKGMNNGFSVYRLCVEKEEGHFLCAVIPPLYEKNGTAWCSVITRKLVPSELIGKRLSVRVWRSGCDCREGRSLAEGVLLCP